MTATKVPLSAWLAFVGLVLIGGTNVVAVKVSNEGLAPLWGAFLRFFVASLVLFLYVLARRIPFPRGRALLGVVIYGVTGFGLAYTGAYLVLKEIPSGLLAILFAAGPLMTMMLASLHGLERLRRRAVIGAIVAMTGLALVVREQLTLDVDPLFLVMAFATLLMMSESGVLVKYFPRPHPAAMNAVGMLIGAAFLLVLSLVLGESWTPPGSLRSTAALGYLVVLGSITMFGLFLFAIARMDVSLISYQFVLMPVVTLVMASIFVDEAITWYFVVGGLIVALGVYVGLGRPRVEPAATTASQKPVTADAAPRSDASTNDAPRP